MPEGIRRYLEDVAREIHWRRARPFALREVETHLTEQYEAFCASGMAPEAAEAAAFRDFGEAADVGKGLDEIHRPVSQWKLLLAIAALMALGLGLRLGLTAGQEPYVFAHPVRAMMSFALGLGAMAAGYLLDYRRILRFGGGIYLLSILAGILAIQWSPVVNNVPYYARYVVLCYPIVYGIFLGSLRGKGWKGVFLAVLSGVPLALLCLLTPYLLALVQLLAVGCVLLALAAGRDWFGVGREHGKRVVALLGAALLAGGLALCTTTQVKERLSLALHPEADALGIGFQGCAVRRVLAGAVNCGQGALEQELPRAMPGWETDFLLTTAIHYLGYLPAAAFFLLVLGLLLVLAQKSCSHGGGALLISSVTGMLLVQLLFAAIQNAGVLLWVSPIPFLSGNLHTVLTMALLGLACGVFRQERLPEDGTQYRLTLERVSIS